MSYDVTPPPNIQEKPQLIVRTQCVRRVNFASAQNDVAVLQSLVIVNQGEEPVSSLKVTATSHPPVFASTTWNVDRIAGNGEIAIRELSTKLDIERLAGLNEAEKGELIVKVETEDGQVFEDRHRLELLAKDEWGGVGDMAQLLAAFVSPNDSIIAYILKEASRLLERAGIDGALDGYQSGDAGRAWLLAGAIWSATTGLGLSYAVPPASFEQEGQKVRSPGRIRSEGLATCLDTSLLLAAAFEAAGLNPAVLFANDHAWVGVWLTKRDFGHVTEPDVIAVRKAAQAKEFVPIETTLATKRPTIGFEQAVDEGRRRLSEDREDEFVMAVDVSRARAARIRPLASHSVAEASSEAELDEAVPAALPKPLDLGLLPGEERDEEPETSQGRIERWQGKLLDLSLRNRLLNFKDTKQSLPFICPNVPALEDGLADGKKFTALALREDDPVAGRSLSPEDRRRIEEDVAQDAFERRQIAVPLTSREMNNRLLALYRKAKSDMQEGGTNTLFLTAGFLRWKKTEGDTRSYRAPLLLIPVKLERRSAQSEFKILHHEDEVRINSTLLQFLKRDFDLRIPELEGDLPHDDSGIDVPKILEVVRHKVRDVAGFEVVEDLALSTFSFAKYLMWKDLVERTDELRKNPLVRHLVDSPTESFVANGESIPPRELDQRLSPAELLTPLPADSSQLAAVVAAAGGQDFVLIGPPGTGKSQTIANVIAQCLANGRTVLFVAEKAAALDVVHRRMTAHGLGDACLELHSNKTDRKAVLTQLGRSWDRGTPSSEAKWIEITDKLKLTRDQLNAYVEALHQKGTQGFSVFQAIGRVAEGKGDVALVFASKDAHDEETYKRLRALASDLDRTHAAVAQGPALELVEADDWSFSWEDHLISAAETLRSKIAPVQTAVRKLSVQLGLKDDLAVEPDRIRALQALLPRIGPDARDLSSVPNGSFDDLEGFRNAFQKEAGKLAEAERAMAASYDASTIGRMPLDQIDADWRKAQVKLWPFSALAGRAVQKLLQSYAGSGTADPARDIRALLAAKDAYAALEENPLAAVADGSEGADLSALDERLAQHAELRRALEWLKPNMDVPEKFGSASAELAHGPRQEMRASLEALREAVGRHVDALDAFRMASAGGEEEFTLQELADRLDRIIQNRAKLSDWTKWIAARGQARVQGLGPLVEALESGRLLEPAELAFQRAYAAWWLPLAMDSSDVLRRFAQWEHEHVIKTFRALDTTAAELAPREVMRRIAHGLPARDGVPRNSELGVLRHQLSLQRPSMPIRSLLGEMQTTFAQLAPCVLMSPLSVAQYLPAGQPAFDVVIFDEASQITTWDAIGAIARGRQAIIVGDPKQLPPTNFFGRADDGDEDLPEIERDMPSILDEVCAAGIPTRRLDWHYRSRDEALIAFSNHHYYGGGLVTFPAPSTGSDAIKFHHVAGTYARGKGRTNAVEAKAITQMIRRRLTSWLNLPEQDRPTLGVITFNGEQQSLILDLLDEVRRGDERLEWFFAEEREEPVIVKNLENIQGDERDVMLFSITFGPDLAGKLTMNFGALNGDGGEKRLNVAVTRARRELHVFSSIHAEQIDLGRTRALGVNHLKAFLDYAERGTIALPAQDMGSLGEAENVFEQAIADALAAKGWEVRTQIGVSGFRIDLGIVHPEFAGAYLAGVECDGAQYHSSATARDRDKVRQAVLEGLGWNIVRIWSTDWFRNANSVTDRVHEALTTLLEDDRERRAREAENASEQEAENHDAPLRLLAPPESVEETSTPEVQIPPSAEEPPEPSSEAPAAVEISREESSTSYANNSSVLGVSASVTTTPDPGRFFDVGYTPTLRAMIATIIETHGPLPLARLGKEVAHLHGWQRTGHRIASRVQKLLGDAEVEDQFGTEFVWQNGTKSDRSVFRGLENRSIREVSRTEIASVIDAHEQDLAASEDPALDLSRLLGVVRLSKDARSYLHDCMVWRAASEETSL